MVRSVLICILLPILVSSFAFNGVQKQGKGFTFVGKMQTMEKGQPTTLRYYLSAHKATQAAAAAECEEVFNGKLLSILNALEDNNIATILAGDLPSGFIHTSGARPTVQDPFVWTAMNPQLPATHFRWAPGAPNALPASLCITVGRNVGVYQWYADNCSDAKQFICEI